MKPRRARVFWTATAQAGLAKLPRRVRSGIIAKAGALETCDPRGAHKPLVGNLSGYYSLKFSRFRAIYQVDDVQEPDGKVVTVVTVVTFVAVGARNAGARADIYALAQRLVKLGVVSVTAKPVSPPHPPE